MARVHVNGIVRTGDAVDLRGTNVDPETLVQAIRGQKIPGSDGTESGGESEGGIAIHCPEPGPLYERVGFIPPEPTVRIRATLAAIARERGLAAPQDEELAQVGRKLAEIEAPELDLAGAREGLAAIDENELAMLRESVAASRGSVQARLELDAPVEPARQALSKAAAELAEAQTERIAAEQRLGLARIRAREGRDVRERRLQLRDRKGNLERAARVHLAGRLRDEFVAAVETVPGAGRVPAGPNSFEGEDVTAALALVRMAELRAPVILACKRFPNAYRAAAVLDTPVIRL